jgi:hypothetical protein
MSKLSTKYKLVLLPDQPSFFFKVEGREGERGAATAEDQSQKTQSFHYYTQGGGLPVPAVFHQLSKATEDVKDKHFK